MEFESSNSRTGARGKYRKDPSKKKIQPFIKKLLQLFDDSGLSNIIIWEEVGNYGLITIIDPERLENEVLPKYYRHTRTSSFIRQLNIHGFKKVFKRREKTSANSLVYVNKYFLRSQQSLYYLIRRNMKLTAPENEDFQVTNLLQTIKMLENELESYKKDPFYPLIEILATPTYEPLF